MADFEPLPLAVRPLCGQTAGSLIFRTFAPRMLMPFRVSAISRQALTLSMLVLLLSAAGCSKFQRVLKSDSVDEKYKAAVEYYDAGRYEKSTIILEELLPLLRGRPEAEKASYLFAQGEFKQQYYELSAFQFRAFGETYPRSAYAEEAAYLYTRSLYLASPKFDLDQSSTISALEAIRDFQQRYPESQFRQKAQDMSEELTAKLELKAFEGARLYAKIRYSPFYLGAAVTSLTTFLKDYPGSKYAEEATYLRVMAQHELARQSVVEKQRERYLEAVGYYQGLVDAFPKSKYLAAAEDLYDDAQKQLNRLNKETPEARK